MDARGGRAAGPGKNLNFFRHPLCGLVSYIVLLPCLALLALLLPQFDYLFGRGNRNEDPGGKGGPYETWINNRDFLVPEHETEALPILLTELQVAALSHVEREDREQLVFPPTSFLSLEFQTDDIPLLTVLGSHATNLVEEERDRFLDSSAGLKQWILQDLIYVSLPSLPIGPQVLQHRLE